MTGLEWPTEARARAAASVDRAVRVFTGREGAHHTCYNAAGLYLLNERFSEAGFVACAGDLILRPDPGERLWVGFFPEEFGEDDGFKNGAFHSWISNENVVIDFASRYYGVGMDWRQPVPPPYLWCAHEEFSAEHIIFKADGVTTAKWRDHALSQAYFRLMGKLAVEFFDSAAVELDSVHIYSGLQ